MAIKIVNDDRVWKMVRKQIKDIDSKKVKVGVISGKTHKGSGLSVADILAIHEYGAPAAGIIARAPIQTTFTVRAADLYSVMYQIALQLLQKDPITVNKGLAILGAWTASAIQNSIRQRIIVQQLKPSTLARKAARGNDDPTALIETAQLVNSITWAIEKK